MFLRLEIVSSVGSQWIIIPRSVLFRRYRLRSVSGPCAVCGLVSHRVRSKCISNYELNNRPEVNNSGSNG